ncbi:MAG: biosynthetic arginine decarboxylase [Bacteriovoracaceae bacterium]|nr:biosynthetic arginine decarboxylase [Bacteriovoracaceae bacterium]
MTNNTSEWNLEKANDTYMINRWGLNYYSINERGNLSVCPERTTTGPQIDISEVIEEMKSKNIAFPAVIRFQDILRSQVKLINKYFKQSIEEANYRGTYFGVYPIKVNQMREVVEEIVDAGAPFNYGLEAGSKTELMAVLAQNENKQSLNVCNGYKDKEFMKLALLGVKLGRKVIVVIEKFSELPLLLQTAEEMNVEPMIGFRAKLLSKSTGKWAGSSGEKAKFGLNSSELIKGINFLKEKNKLQCLKLFHFHIGSQIPDIITIKAALTEAARTYANLRKMGAPIEYFDVGGGVGVDYDGTRTNSQSSINYTFKDYADDVVYILKDICNNEEVDHPHIVSESGRAVTAHHSCVVTNVFGKISLTKNEINTDKKTGEHSLVKQMRDISEEIHEKNYQEYFLDAISKKEECFSAFNLGVIDLEERGKIETLYWQIADKAYQFGLRDPYVPDQILDLKNFLADQYLCNLSVFQSAPDTWAIDQVLPVVPIKRLLEKPTKLCSIVDITCDSDGKLSKFLNDEAGLSNSMAIHEIHEKEDYYIGLFLTGAYQDVMGDMHNLFGRLNEVHVYCDDDDPSDFYIEEVILGNSPSDVLTTMQYTPSTMAAKVKAQIDDQIKRGKIRPREGVELTDFYEAAMKGYTYLTQLS